MLWLVLLIASAGVEDKSNSGLSKSLDGDMGIAGVVEDVIMSNNEKE